ncbi:hypothetical protein SAMN04487963_3455 [Marinobacter zhejiangensis]|uniref:Uncharacterized protein n=1 Tax=Marinobacter zhejiangensis TaxID=488535 RepID=A0A1I4T2T9_9GAMM|nr:hypothetical protein SAMN04487963_3455 [Marinobacter zhejiangensis]
MLYGQQHAVSNDRDEKQPVAFSLLYFLKRNSFIPFQLILLTPRSACRIKPLNSGLNAFFSYIEALYVVFYGFVTQSQYFKVLIKRISQDHERILRSWPGPFWQPLDESHNFITTPKIYKQPA